MFTLLALACAPAQITLGDGSTVRTSAPGITTAESDAVPMPACTDGAAYAIVSVDTNGSDHNDEVSEMDITFLDGSVYQIHNGHVEVPVTDDMRFMTSTLSNESLAAVTKVWLYAADGSVLGTLEPALADPWVSWSCDPP